MERSSEERVAGESPDDEEKQKVLRNTPQNHNNKTPVKGVT